MPLPTVRRTAGDVVMDFEAVSGVYRGERHGASETHRFGFRRPREWTHLDLDGRNGDLYLGPQPDTVGHLIVDGALAVEHPQTGPGHRRLHAIVEQGFPTWNEPPHTVESVTWDGRPAERLRWEVDDRWVETVYDEATKLCVSTSTPVERDELTDLAFDDDVDQDLFSPPPPSGAPWRGGVAYVVEDELVPGRFLAHWEPRSGPGGLLIRRPEPTDVDEALAWAHDRTDDVWLRAIGEEHRRA